MTGLCSYAMLVGTELSKQGTPLSGFAAATSNPERGQTHICTLDAASC